MSEGNSTNESYHTLVRVVNRQEERDYTIDNFEKDAQKIIEEENSLKYEVHAKLYLCALMADLRIITMLNWHLNALKKLTPKILIHTLQEYWDFSIEHAHSNVCNLINRFMFT